MYDHSLKSKIVNQLKQQQIKRIFAYACINIRFFFATFYISVVFVLK